MNLTAIFIRRPVATTLLTLGMALAGMVAFFLLPVSPLPNIDIPTIFVSATMPGASPETMASSVATPLERHLGTISGVTEMTSTSSVGSTRITMQFDIDRDIDGAARDVQAAISAARADLPAALRSNPTYRKVNPADMPFLILALSSDTLTSGQIYDSASNIVQQKLSQVEGVGDVQLNGSSLPAVRVELNPRALFKYGIGLEDVRAALSAANANSPKGAIEQNGRRYQLYVNDTASRAESYRDLIIAYRNNAPVRLSDVAQVVDGVENVRNLGLADGKPAVIILLRKQAGANVIETADRVRAMLPGLQAALPPSVKLEVVNDTTTSIRQSVHDVEETLILSTIFVLLVVFSFLRTVRSALVPSVAVPLSLIGTFGVMYLLGYSLDNFSLMALTIATGFVVDDAIVVLENVTRHIEAGKSRFQAALLGAKEVSFTVVAMSLSLIAVFLPILLMGGLVGRLFREFAVTLSVAIIVSLVISLTTTPMMSAYLAATSDPAREGRVARYLRQGFAWLQSHYERTLRSALGYPGTVMLVLVIAIAINFYLWVAIPKGFFPQQDTGSMMGRIRADQTISFQAMEKKFRQFVDIIRKDPGVEHVVGFTGGGGGPGGGSTNSGFVFVQLKPLSERKLTTDQVIDRLRTKLSVVAGARLYLFGRQDVRVGGRQGFAQFQYTIQGETLEELREWVPKITNALQNVPELEDVVSDREDKGLEMQLQIDRAAAARLGINITQIDNTLYDAFGQRQVSTIYEDQNQYHVIMEVAPEFWQSPETLKDIYVSTSGGALRGTQATGAVAGTVVLGDQAPSGADVASDALRNQQLNAIATGVRGAASTGAALSTRQEPMVPLMNFASYGPSSTPLSVDHQGPFVATTFSFNLAPGKTLGEAVNAINRTIANVHAPLSIHGDFAGTAKLFQQSLSNEPLLILAALLSVYIVLGILYESYVHPITILSTLPSAGAGAILALLLCRLEFSLIALIGVILLIGIVKKNAIMMIDFALQAEREHGLSSREAIFDACRHRFRPIMMTTMAAIFGALPLAAGVGNGAELRQPLGISIIGGLVVSQILTLYTTPVIYLYLDRLRLKSRRAWERFYTRRMGDEAPSTAKG